MLKDEVLSQFDNISNIQSDSELCVLESMIDFYDKQCSIIEGNQGVVDIYQESADGNLLQSIWNAIKKFIQGIINGFKKIINNFKNRASVLDAGGKGKGIASVSAIAEEVLGHGKNDPDDIDSWPVPAVNPKYIVAESYNDELVGDIFTEGFDEELNTVSEEPPQNVAIVVDPKSKIPGTTISLKKNTVSVDYINNNKTLKITYYGFGRFSKTKIKSDDPNVDGDLPKQDKEWYSSPKVALHLMTHDDTRNKITELVQLALRVMKHRKPEDIKELNKSGKISKLVKIFLKPESHTYEVPVSQLTAVQSWASKLLTDMEAFTSTDVNIKTMDPETIKSLNMVVRLLMRIQISLNYISSAFNNMSIIDASFYGQIKSLDKLDEFVDKCIKAGIPPKYIAYNTWLISNVCIRGTGEYKPIFGHARATIFPPNQKIVLKIALSGLGTVSNETESRFTEIFKKMDRIDLIAPVIKDFKNNAIVAMERVNGNFDLSSDVLKAYTKKANDALTEYQNKTGKKLNIKVGSQHIGNVAYDNKYKVYRSIDYGVHYRETK
jgi:hypothetical protein